MAKLTEEQRDAIHARVMERLSGDRVPQLGPKDRARAFIAAVDDAFDDMDTVLVAKATAAGPDVRAWLLANVPTARRIIEHIATVRREVL